MRARLEVPTIKYVYPKEGLVAWADNVVLLADAQNVDEAKMFMNFIMHPENAALISNFARYGNAIEGSEEFMDAEIKRLAEKLESGTEIDMSALAAGSENNEAIIRMRAQIEAAKAKAEAPAPEAPKEKAPDEPAAPDIKEGVKEPVRARDK